MADQFNLLDQDWILVRTGKGAVETVSLLDLFRRSAEIEEILGDLPTQAFAILRVSLAVLHRALDGPEDARAWGELWESGSPPVDVIEAYLEKYRERFDLFHSETPFFQVVGLHTAKNEFSGLEKLIADVPAGHPYFTTRIGRGLDRITYAEAARWLIHLQAFDISGIKSGAVGDERVKGGKGYPIGTGWAGNLGGLYVQGETLWRTLLLNAVPRDQPHLAVFGRSDRPAWEVAPVGPAQADDVAARPYGPTDLYTWQSRRVLLQQDRGHVVGVVVANGDKLTPQNQWRSEPMTAWRRSVPQQKKLGLDLVYMPQTHDPSRALWRGLETMLPLAAPRGRAEGGEQYVAAGVVEWAAEVLEGRSRVTLRSVGMTYGTHNAFVEDIVDDRLHLPIVVLSQTSTAIPQGVIDAVSATDKAVLALKNLASNLVKAAGGTDQRLADGARDRASEVAYAALDGPFRAWCVGLSADVDIVEARLAWHATARRILQGIGDDQVTGSGPDAWAGRVVNGRRFTAPEADGWFRRALREALPVKEELRTTVSEEDQTDE